MPRASIAWTGRIRLILIGQRGTFEIVFCVASAFAQQPPAGSAAAPSTAFKESSMEVRFQLDLKVPDEVIKPYLPEGFTSSVAAQGPAKDCNVRLIFTDRVTVNGSEGKPVGFGFF